MIVSLTFFACTKTHTTLCQRLWVYERASIAFPTHATVCSMRDYEVLSETGERERRIRLLGELVRVKMSHACIELKLLGRHIFISSLHNIYAYIYISFFHHSQICQSSSYMDANICVLVI